MNLMQVRFEAVEEEVIPSSPVLLEEMNLGHIFTMKSF